MAQLYPSVRILRQESLADGKIPLKERDYVKCDFLNMVEKYEIIAPESVLEHVRKNAGKEIASNDSRLQFCFSGPSRKTYPYGIDGEAKRFLEKDEKFFCMAYRQYFYASNLFYGRGKERICSFEVRIKCSFCRR